MLPLLYVVVTAMTAELAVWQRLWNTRVPELLLNTLALSIGVTVINLILGVSFAWILTRYTFPGSGVWTWLLILPLSIPSYVLAYTSTFLLKRGGPVEHLWQNLAGPEAVLFSPFSLTGAVLVLALNTFPFVYLLARSALKNLNVSFEEVAHVTGAGRVTTFIRVSLPLIRPSLIAGLFLAILYVASDFGAVSLLRYQTFTYAVYQKLPGQMTGRDGLNGPLDQEYHRDAECGREYEQQVARKQQGREGRAGLRNRFPVSTGGLIEPASLSEPAFADEKDKGARD